MFGNPESQAMFKNIYRDSGKHAPEMLAKPALRDDCVTYYDAFRHLSASRLWNQAGPQPIQTTEILSFLEIRRIKDPDEREKIEKLVKILDSAHLKHLSKKANRK